MWNVNRLRGLRALLEDAVEHGTSAVERVHRATAARPFDILDHIPPVAPAARGVRFVHDATVAGVYETIRQVNDLVGVTLSAAIDLYDEVADANGDEGGDESQGASVPASGPAHASAPTRPLAPTPALESTLTPTPELTQAPEPAPTSAPEPTPDRDDETRG
jgi:hypothetical protein